MLSSHQTEETFMAIDPLPLMRACIDAAVQSAGKGGPFGALIVRDGHVIATGTNQVTTLRDPTAHAEVQAIRSACHALGSWELRGCELYASAEPCPMCLGATYWARLDRAYYAASRADAAAAGFDDARLYEELALSPDARTLPLLRLLPEEGILPFQAWLKNPHRIPY
jgi:guanine deaminase